MKLVKQHIERDKSGYVTLIPEEFEDMWHVYNLVQKYDQLRAVTIRYVEKHPLRLCIDYHPSASYSGPHTWVYTQFLTIPALRVNSRIQSESSTGSVDSQRIRLTLSISVDNVDFDTQVGMLRISGRVIVENPHVKACQY